MKVCSPPIVEVMIVKMITGRSEGTVMLVSCRQRPAPSTDAASYSSRGIDWSPARYSSVVKPDQRQMIITAITIWLVSRPASQLIGLPPNRVRNQVIRP